MRHCGQAASFLNSAGRSVRRFAADRNGGVVILFSFLVPVMLLAVGGGIDYARLVSQRSTLQSAVDAAAIAAAKEISLTDVNRESLTAVAEAVIRGFLGARQALDQQAPPKVTTELRSEPIQVEVVATSAFETSFGEAFGLKVNEVRVRSVARIVGRPNICVLSLDPSAAGALSLEHKARATGDNCAVYSNSRHTIGIMSKNDAMLTATFTCSAGGIQHDGHNFSPMPIVDCPQFEDPLSDRPEPTIAGCDPNRPTVITGSVVLTPGTYCGLEIKQGGHVTLQGSGSGVFAFKDKPLIVRDGGTLIGVNAGLYFKGGQANFKFETKSTIDLEAPKSGPLAGLLVFASRSHPPSGTFDILSDNARRLIGTIYIPKGELHVDAESPIADESAYTAIVANVIRLFGGPHLILHTNYDRTDVPVPAGIKGAGQPVRLER